METEPYKLDVKDFLIKGNVGGKKTFEIKDSHKLKLDEENVLESYEGELKLTLLEEEILAEFNINYVCKTICARCLKKFDREGRLSFDREYIVGKRAADEGELIVDKEFKIEIGGPAVEEIAFDIPLKPLCKESCKGIK